MIGVHQLKVRHLLVVENDVIDKPLGIITPTSFENEDELSKHIVSQH